MIALAPSTLSQNGSTLVDPLVHEWYDMLLDASFIELDETQAKAILTKLVQQARTLLFQDPFAPRRARFLGASLVSLCQNKPMVLTRTQYLLARKLVTPLTPGEMITLQPQLAQLLSELAVGFLDAQAKEVKNVNRAILSKIGHDLNSPLNLIIGFSGIMLKGLSGELSDLQQNDITTIHQGGKKLQKRIDNLMGIVKVESSITRLKEEFIEIRKLIEEVQASVQPCIDRNENHFAVYYTSNLRKIKVDREMLKQILIALLDNAAKFTVQGTIHLTIKTERVRAKDWVTFEVTDSGLGIPQKRLQVLLEEPLSSFGSTYNGSGGSLLLCRRFCQLMNGTLDGTSVVGQGSTFTLRLPTESTVA